MRMIRIYGLWICKRLVQVTCILTLFDLQLAKIFKG